MTAVHEIVPITKEERLYHESSVSGHERFALFKFQLYTLMLFGTFCSRSHELPDEMGDGVQQRNFRDVLHRTLLWSKSRSNQSICDTFDG